MASARRSQIGTTEEHHSQFGKGDEEGRFGKVAEPVQIRNLFLYRPLETVSNGATTPDVVTGNVRTAQIDIERLDANIPMPVMSETEGDRQSNIDAADWRPTIEVLLLKLTTNESFQDKA